MSFTENDRKFQSKSGTVLREGEEVRLPFAQIIALALNEEFGESPSSMKLIARVTGANERSVRNWFEAKNGPGGESLITLLHFSDTVLKAVLGLAGRRDMSAAIGLPNLRQQLVDLIAAIDRVSP